MKISIQIRQSENSISQILCGDFCFHGFLIEVRLKEKAITHLCIYFTLINSISIHFLAVLLCCVVAHLAHVFCYFLFLLSRLLAAFAFVLCQSVPKSAAKYPPYRPTMIPPEPPTKIHSESWAGENR